MQTQQNIMNPSQRIMVADGSSDLRGGGPPTSSTHDLRVAPMDLQFLSNQPQLLLNVQSDTDT